MVVVAQGIECWVTDPGGTYIAHLDRSAASPFRRFAFSRVLNQPGAGSLEYGLDCATLAANPSLFAFGNLVWMRYRGRTVTWIVEESAKVLDDTEHAADWVKVAGRGALQLLGDRLVWPPAFGETGDGLIPRTWSGVSTTLAVTALKNQKVLDIVGSTKGFYVGKRVTVGGAHHSEQGIVDSRTSGTLTLKRKLAHTYAAGQPVFRQGNQWYEVDGENAGSMLWELIDASNARFDVALAEGTIETDPGDLWTQQFRFDNVLDVVEAVTASYGDVDMDGLTFNYRNQLGTDRSASVIFEEGADVLRAERGVRDQDAITWVVGEGVGSGVFSRFAVATDPSIARRREAYLDAHDAANVALLQARADAALSEHVRTDTVALDVTETRYAAMADWDLGDWVRVIAPSRSIDEPLRIVALYVAETDDEQTRVSVDVNSPRTEHLLRLAQGQKSTAQSLGITSRQPQGQLVPFAIAGTGVFDSDEDMEVFFRLPDRMTVIVETIVNVSLKKFWATARAAAGDTSGSSSASTTSSGGSSTQTSSSGGSSSPTSGPSSDSTSTSTGHDHDLAYYVNNSPPAVTDRQYAVQSPSGSMAIKLATVAGDDIVTSSNGSHQHSNPHHHDVSIGSHSHTVDIPGHTHGMAHTHDIPQLALVYGTFHESLPASWSVTPKVWFLDGTAWSLMWTGDPLTDPDLTAEIDVSDIVDQPGSWKLTLQSDGSGSHNGRLAADVWGSVVGAIGSD